LEGLTSIASTSAEPGRFYATTKRGRVLIFVNGKLRGVFLNIEDRVQSAASEQGLLSIAFHPNYRRNHRFYVDYTDFRGDTRVIEFRSRNGRAIKSSGRRLLFVKQPEANHNGGELQFDRNGLLYVGMGDGGEPGDPNNRAQSMSDRLGKILRLDPLRRGAAWQVAGLGLRNPWRFSFDRANGDLLSLSGAGLHACELRLATFRGPRSPLPGLDAGARRARRSDPRIQPRERQLHDHRRLRLPRQGGARSAGALLLRRLLLRKRLEPSCAEWSGRGRAQRGIPCPRAHLVR
jgi:hypothetical protein